MFVYIEDINAVSYEISQTPDFEKKVRNAGCLPKISLHVSFSPKYQHQKAVKELIDKQLTKMQKKWQGKRNSQALWY